MKSVFKKTIVLIVVGAASILLMGGTDQTDRGNLLKPDVFEYKFLDGNRLARGGPRPL